MRGWSVFTRPPSISGAEVTSSTCVTSRPSSSRYAAVPPLATNSNPTSARPRAKTSRPSFSHTEISARIATTDRRRLPPGGARFRRRLPPLSARCSPGPCCSHCSLRPRAASDDSEAASEFLHDLWEEPVLDGLYTRAQEIGRIAGIHRHAFSRDHGTGVDSLVHVVHRRGGLRDTGREHVFDRMRARELGERRRVRVDDPAAVVVEEGLAEKVHVACADNELDASRLEPSGQRDVAFLPLRIVACFEDGCGD